MPCRLIPIRDRYGRVQSVKLLSRPPPNSGKDEAPSESTMACTVAFMDIKSASKAHTADHKIDDRTLTTEYYEPAAIPSSAPSPQNNNATNAGSGYATSPASNRFPNGHGTADEHAAFTERFYERTASRVPPTDADFVAGERRRPSYHENTRSRNRDRAYRNGPYNNVVDRGTASATPAVASRTIAGGAQWPYDSPRYSQTSETGYISTPSDNSERRSGSDHRTTKGKKPKQTKSRSGSRSASPASGSSRSGSRASSCSSTSSTDSRATSGASSSSPRSRRLPSDDRRPLAICVRNLPTRSSDTSLKDGLFHEYKKHGKVTWVKVVGQSADRHAIVCFKKPEDAEKALEVSYDKMFFGSKIEVAPYMGYDVDEFDFRSYEADVDEFHPRATRTLFIGNLEKDVTASDLRKHFDQFGEIIEIDIKKQGAVSSYAFCQYSDIVSVVKAIRTMDGEHLGNNRIKLGFGKSMPTVCVWIDGIAESVNEKYLMMQFDPFGAVQQVIIDRDKGQALVFYDQVLSAQTAVTNLRGASFRGRKVQLDFASRECQEAFREHLEKQGLTIDRSLFDDSSQPPPPPPTSSSSSQRRSGTNASSTAAAFDASALASRFSRSASGYDVPSSARPRTASYSSGVTARLSGSANVPPSPGTPGSLTPRSRRLRYADYYEQGVDYVDRHFRSYDEYSQGSGASHEDPYDHDYIYAHSSPSHVEGFECKIVVAQKERPYILDPLEDCHSSGDELLAPKKRLKLVEILESPNDVIIEANRDHRKVTEVRRLSDVSLKHHRRPSVDTTKHLPHPVTPSTPSTPSYLPHPICKRRKTGGSDGGGGAVVRPHHYDHSGSESIGSSRPGTPLCDERPEHFPPTEPRRVPREREGPLSLPLPKFAAQVMNHRGSVSVAGIKGQKEVVVSNCSPPATATSPRVSQHQKPPSPAQVPPPASPPPRPPSLSSNSSDSDVASSPSLDERIKSLDEKYEKWSGSRALSAAGNDALAKLDANRDRFRFRHKLLDLDLKELQPSEIVKSVMAKRSVFDEDSKRLENVGEKYEPRDFPVFPRHPAIPVSTTVLKSPSVVSPLPVTSPTVVKTTIQHQQQQQPPPPPQQQSQQTQTTPKPATVMSPRSTSAALTSAKGLQYPFPTHPPMHHAACTQTTATSPPLPVSSPTATTNPPTPTSTSVIRSTGNIHQRTTSITSDRTPCATKVSASATVKVSSRRESTASSPRAGGGSRRNSEDAERMEEAKREQQQRLEKAKLEAERLERERAEELLQREKEEKERREKEERERKEREEREKKEREERERREREEREEKERKEREEREREEKERQRQQAKLLKEKEDNHRKEDRYHEHKKDSSSEHHHHHESNKVNNVHKTPKSDNRERHLIDSRHSSLDSEKMRHSDSAKRKERNNSLPASVGSKRRASGQEEINEEAKKPKLSQEHKKLSERRDSKEDRLKQKHKTNSSKSHEKSNEREDKHKKSSKLERQKSKKKDTPHHSPNSPKDSDKEFLAKLDLQANEDLERHKKKESKEKQKVEHSKEKSNSEKKHKESENNKDQQRKQHQQQQQKKERIRKNTQNRSDNTDSDEPRKPMYFSMYDVVKSKNRNASSVQKIEEEEKEKEKLKAKFSQLKKSRARREEKKRSTSWDEDSDSDRETPKSEFKMRKMSKMLITSSDDEDFAPVRQKQKKQQLSSRESEYEKNTDEEESRMKLKKTFQQRKKEFRSRIPSDTSDDEFEKVKNKLQKEIFCENDEHFADSEEKVSKKAKDEFFDSYIKKETTKKTQETLEQINAQIFGDSNSPILGLKPQDKFSSHSSADESIEMRKDKLEVRKKHKKKQKHPKATTEGDETEKTDSAVDSIQSTSDEKRHLDKKKQHAKKEKKKDKEDRNKDKSKKPKKPKQESKHTTKVENLLSSVFTDDSETGGKEQGCDSSIFSDHYDVHLTSAYASDTDSVSHEHKRSKEKKKKKRVPRLHAEVNESSMDYADMGKMLEDNIKDDAPEAKAEPEKIFTFQGITEHITKEERKEMREKKKKRKRSKEEKQGKHHHRHHHESKEKPVKSTVDGVVDEKKVESDVKESVNQSLPNLLDNSSSSQTTKSSVDYYISPVRSQQEQNVSPKEKKREKLIPGFGTEIDEKLHENAVKSISEFEVIAPEASPKVIEEEPKVEKPPEPVDDKPRVIISQEETEDAVAALLGESFGGNNFSYDEDDLDQTIKQEPEVNRHQQEDDEEMRQAVQSLNAEDIDAKPDTPQSENDLQIDTDTEEQEEVTQRFDSPKTPEDTVDLSHPPKTPEVSVAIEETQKTNEVQKEIRLMHGPPSLTPIKSVATEVVKPTQQQQQRTVICSKEDTPIEPPPPTTVVTSSPQQLTNTLRVKIPEGPYPPLSVIPKLTSPPPLMHHNLPPRPPPQESSFSPRQPTSPFNRLPITSVMISKPLQSTTVILPQPKALELPKLVPTSETRAGFTGGYQHHGLLVPSNRMPGKIYGYMDQKVLPTSVPMTMTVLAQNTQPTVIQETPKLIPYEQKPTLEPEKKEPTTPPIKQEPPPITETKAETTTEQKPLTPETKPEEQQQQQPKPPSPPTIEDKPEPIRRKSVSQQDQQQHDETKDDSDYWSAKDVNIDSVIKTLCSADELSASEGGKEEWPEGKKTPCRRVSDEIAKTPETDVLKCDEQIDEGVGDGCFEEKGDVPVRGGRRGGRGRGRKAKGGEGKGVQTRRGGKGGKDGVGRRGGRGGIAGNRQKVDNKKNEDVSGTGDVYEFRDDSDESNTKEKDNEEQQQQLQQEQRPRLILTIKPSNMGAVKDAVVTKAGNNDTSATKEEFVSPGTTRKSRRLQEKDISRNTVDDTIEDVVRNTSVVTRAAATRRATRQVGKSPQETPRKSPRGRRKDRRASETTDDSSEEKFTSKTEAASPDVIPKDVTPIVPPAEEPKPLPELPRERPHEGLKAAVLRRVKGESQEPMTLIDPVTGLLTPVREAEEGRYIPVPGANKPPTPQPIRKPPEPIQQPTVIAKPHQKPQSFKQHVLAAAAAKEQQQQPIHKQPPLTQHLNVNVSLPGYTPSHPHLSPRQPIPAKIPVKVNHQLPPLSPSQMAALANQQIHLQAKPHHLLPLQQQQQPLSLPKQPTTTTNVPPIKQQIILNKATAIMKPQMVSRPVAASPTASQQRLQPPPMSKESMVARPNLSPQQAQPGRHVLQAGMPVPAYEASLHGERGVFNRSRSPPPAHQNSPSPKGESMAHYQPGPVPLRPPHDLPPAHYLHHPQHVMYQQFLRQSYHMPRSLPSGLEKPGGDGQEGEEAPVTSPPLELRRPGSVGLALIGRSATAPHPLASPHDRTTESPQVGQIYSMHGARLPPSSYHRFYEQQQEPPPAHRPLTTSHSFDRGLTHLGPLGGGCSAAMGVGGHPHSPPERPLSTHALASLGAAGNLMGAVARHVSADAPASQRGLQAATPPHASQVPPQAESLLMLLKQYPCMWQGLLALKNDQAAVQMYFVSGNENVAKMSLPRNMDGSTPPLRIFQRMRLEPPQVEGVARKMQMESEHCMMLALPCGHDHMDVLKQSTNLTQGFITYLQQKQAAGIVNVAAPGTTHPPAYVVHIFPSCDFVNENLRRIAPSLLERVADIAHLLIVITTV